MNKDQLRAMHAKKNRVLSRIAYGFSTSAKQKAEFQGHLNKLPVFTPDDILFDHKQNHSMIGRDRFGSVYPENDIREMRKIRNLRQKHIDSLPNIN